MQVFLPYKSPLKVAKVLDKKRLNKQIVECTQIIKGITDSSYTWSKHPIVKMYKNHLRFIQLYQKVLILYRDNANSFKLKILNFKALCHLPSFITKTYINLMKSRLYTKDEDYYKCFKEYGKSYYNLYYIDKQWIKYDQKHKI